MVIAESRKYLQRRAISPTRTTTRKQQLYIKQQVQSQTTQQIQKTIPKSEKPKVNYEQAWETAMKHFDRGRGGAYLYWMKNEARANPQTMVIYNYVKELIKQQRAGNISPTGTKLAAEKVKLRMFPEKVRQEQQAAIEKYNKAHPSLIANKYKLSMSTSDILSGKIFEGVGKIKADVPVEARLKPGDIADIIRGKPIGKIIDEKRRILEKITMKETNKFKISLENSSKELPSGVSFAKDNRGNIVGIIDRNINKKVPLSSLNKYISDDKLKKLGLGSMVKFNAQELAEKVKITPSNIPGKVIVEFLNGRKGTINSKGRVIVGKNLAGHEYIFQDGVIIAVDGKTTFAREEFIIPEPSVEKVGEEKRTISQLWINKELKWLSNVRGKLATKSQRTRQKNLMNELKLLGLTIVEVIIGGGVALLTLPVTIVKLAVNPSQILAIPGAISGAGKNFGRMMRVSPTEVLGVIAGEVLLFKGTGSTLRVVGRVSTKVKNVILPVLNKVDKTRFTVNGNTIKLAGGTASTAESLAKQAARAGKKAVPVTALSDDMFSLIEKFRGKTVAKPIPGEALLSPSTKRLLRKFDAGRASKSEIIKLDRLIRIETKGAGSLLERVTYADPAGRVRTSRLGLGKQKDATLLDILTGDFTFRTNKPQILVFDKITIEAFPASLKIIAKKFKAGKTLTQAEADALLKFQLKKSGKWKPIGAVSKESEIVLAPGELIQRVKTVGHVNIGGQRIPVVKVKVVKSSGNLKILLDKLGKNKISSIELRRLQKLLEKKTGFKNSISRSGNSRPVARFPGLIGRRGRVSKRPPRRPPKRVPKRPVKRPPRRPPKRVPKRPVKRPPRRPPKRVPKRPVKRPPRRPPKRPPKAIPRPPVIPFRLKKKFEMRKLTKSQPVFYVKVKRKGRLVNLNPRPLTYRDAKDFLTHSLDRGIVRSGFFENIGSSKSVVRIPKAMRGYFARNKRKVRPYKIKLGKKKKMLNGLIEKRRFALDHPQERATLKRMRKKALSMKGRRKAVRKQPIKKKATNKAINQRKAFLIKKRSFLVNKLRKQPVRRVNMKRPVRRKSKKRTTSTRKQPTLNQLKDRKRLLISRRRRMLNQLKKKKG